jgi:hypothetical protein
MTLNDLNGGGSKLSNPGTEPFMLTCSRGRLPRNMRMKLPSMTCTHASSIYVTSLVSCQATGAGGYRYAHKTDQIQIEINDLILSKR